MHAADQSSFFFIFKVCCVYPNCGMLVPDLYEHLTGNECVPGRQLEKCGFCKVQVNPGSTMEVM